MSGKIQKVKFKMMRESADPRCHYCGYKLVIGNATDCHTATINGQQRRWPLLYLQIPALGYDFATIDHVVAKANKGTNSEKNCVLSCQTCNCHKGNQSYAKYMKFIREHKDYRKFIHKKRVKLFRGWHVNNEERRRKRLDAGHRVPEHYSFDRKGLEAVDLYDDLTFKARTLNLITASLLHFARKAVVTASRISNAHSPLEI